MRDGNCPWRESTDHLGWLGRSLPAAAEREMEVEGQASTELPRELVLE